LSAADPRSLAPADPAPAVPAERCERQPRWRATPDWPTIEREYASGRRSLRELAARHRCAHSTIANKAQRAGWRRNMEAVADKGREAGSHRDTEWPPRRRPPTAEGNAA
jgi:hypothetical protein